MTRRIFNKRKECGQDQFSVGRRVNVPCSSSSFCPKPKKRVKIQVIPLSPVPCWLFGCTSSRNPVDSLGLNQFLLHQTLISSASLSLNLSERYTKKWQPRQLPVCQALLKEREWKGKITNLRSSHYSIGDCFRNAPLYKGKLGSSCLYKKCFLSPQVVRDNTTWVFASMFNHKGNNLGK